MLVVVVVQQQTARWPPPQRSAQRSRLMVTTDTGISFSGRCKRSFVRTYFTTLLRMPTLQIPLNLIQRYSSTRISTCSLQIYKRNLEERLYFFRPITKSFCGRSTYPRASDPREQRQQWQSTKSHLKNKLKQENRWPRMNLFQTLCTICCSSARERTLRAKFAEGSQWGFHIYMAKLPHSWFSATFNLTLFSKVGTYLTCWNHVLIH